MSLSISGSQFVKNGDVKTYVVSGIPSGYTLDSESLPNGWTQNTVGTISAGSQSLTLNVGIGSGTIIINYINSGNILTIYYDVYVGAQRRGEELKQDGAILITSVSGSNPPILNDPRCQNANVSNYRGVYSLDVFADVNNPTVDLQNDKSDFYFYGNVATVSLIMTMQKFVNGAWVDSFTISDNTYGNFFAFGKSPDFSGNSFTDDFGKKYTGILLNWLTVLQNKDYGSYRMKIVSTDMFSNVLTFYSKSKYNLYQWNSIKPNGTIRIESLNIGLRGILDDNTIQIDYSTGWYSQIRLKGLFLYKGSAYNKEYNQYGDADFNIYKPIIQEQVPKYSLTKLYLPSWLVWYLSTNINQADTINITDYNILNRFALIKTPVMPDGDFAMGDNNLVDPYGDIMIKLKLDFAYSQNNLRKRNS